MDMSKIDPEVLGVITHRDEGKVVLLSILPFKLQSPAWEEIKGLGYNAARKLVTEIAKNQTTNIKQVADDYKSEMRDVSVNVPLWLSLHAALRKAAFEDGISKSRYIQNALEETQDQRILSRSLNQT